MRDNRRRQHKRLSRGASERGKEDQSSPVSTPAERVRPVYVVCDLHVFSPRSHADRHMNAIREAAASAERFVFNGDTFDFRWTYLPSIEQTVERAIQWLAEFAATFPRCQFHFVVGNHDNVKPFIDALTQLAATTPNLFWHPFYLRLGDCIFLHGDVANRRMTAASLAEYRAKWLHDRKRGRVWHSIHDMAYLVHLHKAVCRAAFPKERVARRVLAYLEDIQGIRLEGIRHVYIGHTHLPINNYVYQGLHFHNSGTALKGLEFNMIRVPLHSNV